MTCIHFATRNRSWNFCWYSCTAQKISMMLSGENGEIKWKSQIQHVHWSFLRVYDSLCLSREASYSSRCNLKFQPGNQLQVEIPTKISKQFYKNLPYKDSIALYHIYYISSIYLCLHVFYYSNLVTLTDFYYPPKLHHPTSPHPSCWPCVRSGSLRTPEARSGGTFVEDPSHFDLKKQETC